MKTYLFFILLMFSLVKNVFAHEIISNAVTPVGYFVNHVEQLDRLNQNLIKYRKTSIVGISGTGKTQLARMYAYENRENYQLIWSIDCNLDLNDQLLNLAQEINKKDKSANISEDLFFLRKQLFEYLTAKKEWLLILDNLKIGDNDKISDFIEWENNGHIIFCSQEMQNLPHVLKVNKFSDDNIQILAKKILEDQNAQFINFLVKELDGYPVLIVQGAQVLNNIKGLEYKQYKKQILNSSDKILVNIKLALKNITPTARELLNVITLINNQEFSKNFLRTIVSSKENLEEDIYQLSKFGLIQNIHSNEENPVFEMHDIISYKLLGLNEINNKKYVETIISKIITSMTHDIIQGHVYRNKRIVQKNLEIILKNAEIYKANLQDTMTLRLHLFNDYINTYNHYKASQMVNWFQNQDQAFLLKEMSSDVISKSTYARYLVFIGAYYKRRYMDYNQSTYWYLKAKTIFDDIQGYDLLKCNLYYNLALNNIGLGQEKDALQYIGIVEDLLNTGKIEEKYKLFQYIAKAKLLSMQGKTQSALEQINLALESFLSSNVHPKDLLLTQTYLVKGSILNDLKQYSDASKIIEHLYQMYKEKSYGETHNVYGRIFLQKARAALGLKQNRQAEEYVDKVIKIFNAEENIPPSDSKISINPELAQAYALKGDLEFDSGNAIQALKSYRVAQVIYFYLYGNNSKNVAKVSSLYLQGAKAACKAKDLYHYKCFGNPQIEEFGIDHLNSIKMLEYCKKYGMNLWNEEN